MFHRVKRPVRHLLPPAAALCLGAALVIAPVPAHAAAATGINVAQISFDEASGGPACTVSSSGITSSIAISSNGVTTTRTASGGSTIADPGQPADTTTASASAKSVARATEAGGSVKSIDLKATLSATLNAAQGELTDCDATSSASGAAAYSSLVMASAHWLTLSGDLPVDSSAVIVIGRTVPASPPWQQVIVLEGGHAEPNLKVLLPAGQYGATLQTRVTVEAPATAADPNPASKSAQTHVHGDFVPVGTATNTASGAATKYLKFPGSRKCATDQLKTKFKAAAGEGASAKIKKATFYINGDKVKAVNLPIRNEKTTLINVPSGDKVTLKVKLELFGGGVQKASRSYLSCT